MIISIILLLILALALWGIYMMAGKAVNGVPLAIVGSAAVGLVQPSI